MLVCEDTEPSLLDLKFQDYYKHRSDCHSGLFRFRINLFNNENGISNIDFFAKSALTYLFICSSGDAHNAL